VGKFGVNLADLLSWSRIFATPLVMLLLFVDSWSPAYLLAAVLLALAEITDVLDGYIARRQKSVSNLGIFLDLTADKLFTAGVLIMMVGKDMVSAWLVAIILGREFLITGMRTYAAAEGVVIPAGRLGKLKTVFTAIALTWLVVWADAVLHDGSIHNGVQQPIGILHAADQWTVGNFQPLHWFFELAWPLMYWVVFMTIWSGFLYMKNAAYLFRGKPKSTRPTTPEPPTPENRSQRVTP
jgi:CDP-diacylglycerol--glycerol-3-phosphate 3-phosphatidyltransferase